MIHPMGRQMLNLFPLPDPALVGNPVTQGNYNYQFAGDTEKLRRDHVVRVDWNIRPGTTFYTRIQTGKEIFGRGQYNDTATGADCRRRHGVPVVEWQLRHQHRWLRRHAHAHLHGLDRARGHRRDELGDQDVYPLGQSDWDALDYRNHLPGHRQYFTENNPNHILPDMTFAGTNALPNTRAINIGQGQAFPWLASNPAHNFSVNLTHLRGKHNLKAGFFYERSSRPGAMSSNAGTYNFNSDAANPLDTNLGWANALLGHLNTYTENNNNTRSMPQYNQPEFFVQDNWRLNRKFTLDVGVRFSHIGVVREPGRDIGWFDPNAWDPAKAVQLWQPHCANGVFPCTGANRVARNPLTGEQRASPWIGAVVAGSGDINNGTVFGKGLPDTFPSAGIRTAPRLGFGWDVFGDGKTAVRGGFGTSYNRLGDGQYGGFTGVISRTVSLQWTTIDDRFNAPSLENPLAGTAVQEETRPITVHSWSIGVQRELPWRLLADVAYVGNTTRNAFAVNAGQSYTNQLNDPDPRLVANPTPSMIDPTTGNVLPTNLIRPNYPGRGAVTQRVFLDELYRNYHAIQFEIRRRLANGFAWAANYTGSITEQYQGYDWYRTAEENEARNTHNNGGRPHNAKFTYNWMIPGPSRFLGDNVIVKAVLDDWQFSGITTMLGGTWSNFSCANGLCFTGSPSANALTGGLGGMRPIIVCDPNLPRSERTFDRQYRTECVQPPGPRTDPSDTLYQGTGVGQGQEDARMGLGLHQPRLHPDEELQPGKRAQPAGARGDVQRVQHHAVPGREHATDVRLRDRRADEPGLRVGQRRARQFEPRDPARGPADVLIGFKEFKGSGAQESRAPEPLELVSHLQPIEPPEPERPRLNFWRWRCSRPGLPLFASDYLTEGNDPGRTGWMKDEKVFTLANVKDMKLLWKVKLDSKPREMHNLFSPLIADRVTTARGAREVAIVAGISDDLFGIDVASGELLWKKRYESTFAPTDKTVYHTLCLGGQTAMPAMEQVSPGKYTIYAIAWDGRLHQINAADGADVAPPDKFLPPNGKPYALNVVNGVVYTATAQGCGGIPNALYSYHLATRKASVFIPAGGGMWGRRGAAVSPEGVVYMVTGDAMFSPRDQEPRQRHRRRQARRQPATAARRLLRAEERQLDARARSGHERHTDGVRLPRTEVPRRHEQGMPRVAPRSRRARRRGSPDDAPHDAAAVQ